MAAAPHKFEPMEAQLARLDRTFLGIERSYDPKEIRQHLRPSAKVFIDAARDRAPRTNKPHHRKKNGKIIATYHPGNLRRSIKVLPLRRMKYGLGVGPYVQRRGKGGGDFKGSRVDAYYAHFVEYGTVKQSANPYMRSAYDSTRGTVLATAKEGMAKLTNTIIRKYAQSS